MKERNTLDEENESEPGMIDERLKLVAGFAEKYRDVDLIRTRSMYSLFDLAPYDAPIGIDEKQQNLNDLIQTLEEAGQVRRNQAILRIQQIKARKQPTRKKRTRPKLQLQKWK